MAHPELAREPKIADLSRDELSGRAARSRRFACIYAEYFPFVWRTLRLLGVKEGSLEDAAQDVFGVVYRRLGEFEGRSELGTWIFSIARRVAANHHRTQRRKCLQLEPLTGAEVSPSPTPLAEVEAKRAVETLVAFCQTLDEERRALFVLGLVEGLPAPELATPLGLPLNTVYSRIRALRQALRNFLESCEVET